MSEIDALKQEFAGFSTYTSTPAAALDLLDRARDRCPVPHSDQLGGFHIFMTYEDVRKGLLDWRTFASGPSVLRPYVEGTPKFPPSSYDPPEHSPWRQIFSDGVNTRSAERITPAVHTDIVDFIEGFSPRGTCDLVADLAERVPMNAIFYILGLEESLHETVRHLTLKTLASVSDMEVFKANFIEFAGFGYAQVEKKRDNPADDYLTVLAQARMGDRLLTPDEIGACVISLLTAGHGTTVASMTNLFYEVLRKPELKQQLIDDPSLIPVAVEEGLRMHHPFFGLYRQATRDVTVNGSDIKAGETVYLCWQGGNRDPGAFPDPNTFRLDRPSNAHLSFGLGRHSCVGAATARMEMQLALKELLTRLPDIELVDPGSIKFEFHGAETAAIPALPARFTPRS
ncbi:cytochrome P450 [soil metagenome]